MSDAPTPDSRPGERADPTRMPASGGRVAWILLGGLAFLGLIAFVATHGGGEPGYAKAARQAPAEQDPVHGLLAVILVLVLGCLLSAALGIALAVVRVVLPPIAHAGDRTLASGRTGRVLVAGILLLAGALLLSIAGQRIGQKWVEAVLVLGVWVPLLLAAIAGALAAVPHLGRELLRRRPDRSPILEAAIGGLALGLSQVTWIFKPLGLLVTVLLAAWLVGIGVRAVIDRPPTT